MFQVARTHCILTTKFVPSLFLFNVRMIHNQMHKIILIENLLRCSLAPLLKQF